MQVLACYAPDCAGRESCMQQTGDACQRISHCCEGMEKSKPNTLTKSFVSAVALFWRWTHTHASARSSRRQLGFTKANGNIERRRCRPLFYFSRRAHTHTHTPNFDAMFNNRIRRILIVLSEDMATFSKFVVHLRRAEPNVNVAASVWGVVRRTNYETNKVPAKDGNRFSIAMSEEMLTIYSNNIILAIISSRVFPPPNCRHRLTVCHSQSTKKLLRLLFGSRATTKPLQMIQSKCQVMSLRPRLVLRCKSRAQRTRLRCDCKAILHTK